MTCDKAIGKSSTDIIPPFMFVIQTSKSPIPSHHIKKRSQSSSDETPSNLKHIPNMEWGAKRRTLG